MAEIFTKNSEGEVQKLGDVSNDQLSRIKNDANISDIKDMLSSFWTSKKKGKYTNMDEKHGSIIVKDLKSNPADFFEQLSKNTFTFQDFGPYSWNMFLRRANLDQLVDKDKYLDDCLKVRSGKRPEIGQGEFLFVASFNNINFASESGDLVDNEGNRIEVKGKHSNFGGDIEGYRPFNSSIMTSLYSVFGTNGPTRTEDYIDDKKKRSQDLTLEIIEDLQEKLIKNPQKTKQIMKLLQNRVNHSEGLANQMVELFNSKHDLKHVIAASHLLTYVQLQHADFILALNDNVYWGFKSPKTLAAAYDIVCNFNINAWVTGNKGISVTVNNGRQTGK